MWSTEWGLGVPSALATPFTSRPHAADAATVFAAFAQHDWIGNSRNAADEKVLRLISSMAGFEPTMRHQSDSLDLVEDLVLANLGVGLLPRDRPPRQGLSILPLANPDLQLRAYARTRQGRSTWPALALVLQRLRGEQE
jgi:DNA-binding transcriptional LysR family regulator